MYKLMHWFKNLKFKNKIILTCILVSLVPLIMLGSFCYLQIHDLLIKREINALEESLEQASNTLEYKIESCLNVMNHIIWDKGLKDSLDVNYESNYDMYIVYRDIIEPIFMTSRSLHMEINNITIYTNNPINPHGNMVRPLSDIEGYAWFDNTLKTTLPKLIVSQPNRQFNIACQLYGYTLDYTNIIYLDVDYEHIFNAMSTLFEASYGVIILDQNNNLAFEFHDFPDSKQNYALSPEILLKKLNNNTLDKDYVFDSKTLEGSGLTIHLYRPIETVSASANKITLIVLAIIIICICIIFLTSYYLSAIIVRPLEQLSANMEQIESGDLTIRVTEDSTDEIGHLIRRFGLMVTQLRYLIDEVYKSKIAEQDYEMKALQSQINPHFFYNSLSLINSKAIMAEQEDISQMAQFLSTFYRTTLNRGKNTISIKDEWSNVVSYIQIQCMMHSNSFDVNYELDNKILNYTVLNLLLQPLVENAIGHGLDHKITPGRGVLTISGKQSDNDLIFIVSDNGPGMEANILENILTNETSGYGAQNVHRRVQLYYGKDYGLSYNSIPGKGTTVFLTIPKKNDR